MIVREDSAKSQGLIFVEEQRSRLPYSKCDMSDNMDRVNIVALNKFDLELSCG